MTATHLIIAIDGPAASGKGTLAMRIAAHFGLAFLDTGLLYRAVARDVRRNGGTVEDERAAIKAALQLDAATLDDPACAASEPARPPRSWPAYPRCGRRCSSSNAPLPASRPERCWTGAISAPSYAPTPTLRSS
jgi:hypothetical protein